MPEPTIEEHIKRARELTPQQTRVTEPAFEELIKAVEKMAKMPLMAGWEDLDGEGFDEFCDRLHELLLSRHTIKGRIPGR